MQRWPGRCVDTLRTYVGDGECFAVMRAEDRGGGTPAVVSFPLDETPRHTHTSRATTSSQAKTSSRQKHTHRDARREEGCHTPPISPSLSLSNSAVCCCCCCCCCCVALWGHMPLTGTPCGEMAYGSAKQCYFDTGVRTNDEQKSRARLRLSLSDAYKHTEALTTPIELLLSSCSHLLFSTVPKHRSRSPRQGVSGQWMQCS